MKSVLIGTNNLVQIKQYAYANHIQLQHHLGKISHSQGLKFILCNPTRMSIDKMRNFCANVAIANKIDYILFLDDDVMPPVNAVERLVQHDKDVCSGITLIRGFPYAPMVFDFKRPKSHFVFDYMERAHPKTGLLKVDAVGFSLCLLKTKTLAKVEAPWFVTSENMTEDVYYCKKLKHFVPKASIFADTTIHTAHILGDDYIEPQNRLTRMLYDMGSMTKGDLKGHDIEVLQDLQKAIKMQYQEYNSLLDEIVEEKENETATAVVA